MVVAMGWDDVGQWLSSDGALLVYGALLAGIVGLVTHQLQQHFEMRARRAALIGILNQQLQTIHPNLPAFDGKHFWTRSTIHISSVGQLLDGGTLDPSADRHLIGLLSTWVATEMGYNEKVKYTNQAIVTMVVMRKQPDEAAILINNMQKAHETLLQLRSILLDAISSNPTLPNLPITVVDWPNQSKHEQASHNTGK
jgi:hypothetical protein